IVFDGAIEVISLSPLDESPFFNGTEVIVAGRYIEGMTVTTSIDYVTGTETYVDTVGIAMQDKPHVEHIWAQQRVSYLLRQASLHGENDTLRNEIVQLGMYYGIAIAGYTAMVLTAYDASSTGEGTLDGFYGYVPTTTTGSPAQLPADFAMGSTLLVPILLIGIGLVVIVLLNSKFRKG
ncbi:MAG: hypothetical protein V3V85_03760, partial [Candidatus Thorarchaeota archaeon]